MARRGNTTRAYASYLGVRIPSVDAQEMLLVDRLMTETFGISLGQMMESAGAALAALALGLRRRPGDAGPIVVLAGPGGNGGGGLVAARRLAAWGRETRVILATDRLDETTEIQRKILDRMGVPVTALTADEERVEGDLARASLLVDALLGYGLRGAPRDSMARLIRLIRQAKVRTLSLDLPSGLDPSTGAASNPTVLATATLTLALPKAGLLRPSAKVYVGRLYLADIGIPVHAYARMGLAVPRIFRGKPYVPLETSPGRNASLPDDLSSPSAGGA